MCQRDNNPTIEKTTAEGHQQVFNVTRNSRTSIIYVLFYCRKVVCFRDKISEIVEGRHDCPKYKVTIIKKHNRFMCINLKLYWIYFFLHVRYHSLQHWYSWLYIIDKYGIPAVRIVYAELIYFLIQKFGALM